MDVSKVACWDYCKCTHLPFRGEFKKQEQKQNDFDTDRMDNGDVVIIHIFCLSVA